MSDRTTYWRHLAEEHGDCTREFMSEPAIQPDLCYQQASVAGHFGRLALDGEEADLEAPTPGTICPDCGEIADGVKGFCAICHDRRPMTINEFLSYAANSTVNSR